MSHQHSGVHACGWQAGSMHARCSSSAPGAALTTAPSARTSAVKVEVVFAHTPTYPEEPPLLKARG